MINAITVQSLLDALLSPLPRLTVRLSQPIGCFRLPDLTRVASDLLQGANAGAQEFLQLLLHNVFAVGIQNAVVVWRLCILDLEDDEGAVRLTVLYQGFAELKDKANFLLKTVEMRNLFVGIFRQLSCFCKITLAIVVRNEHVPRMYSRRLTCSQLLQSLQTLGRAAFQRHDGFSQSIFIVTLLLRGEHSSVDLRLSATLYMDVLLLKLQRQGDQPVYSIKTDL